MLEDLRAEAEAAAEAGLASTDSDVAAALRELESLSKERDALAAVVEAEDSHNTAALGAALKAAKAAGVSATFTEKSASVHKASRPLDSPSLCLN